MAHVYFLDVHALFRILVAIVPPLTWDFNACVAKAITFSLPYKPRSMGNKAPNEGRYKVFLPDGTVLREFDDADIAMHFSEQVWSIGGRHNVLRDTATGKVIADFSK